MVKDVTVGEKATLNEVTGNDTDIIGGGFVDGKGLVGGHDKRANGSYLQADVRTAVASNTIAIAEAWTEIDVNGDSSGNAIIDVSGSYNGALLSFGGEAKVVVEAFLIDKTVDPGDDLVTDVGFEKTLAGGKEKYDGTFTETLQEELFPSSNYLIGVRLRAEASSEDWRSFLYAESDFYDQAASDTEVPTEGYASYDEAVITWR